MRIGILEGDHFSAVATETLRCIGTVEEYAGGPVSEFVADKDVLFVRLGYRIDEPLLNSAPMLRYLCSPTTGHNHLDDAALLARGIQVVSLRGEREFLNRIRATPEHTLGLILALLRNYRIAFVDSEHSHWDRDRCRGDELFGMRVGIIGLGRVGAILAGYLQALGARVSFTDPRREIIASGCERYDSVNELLANNALIVMCASYRDGQLPILDEQILCSLKGKYFVNTARGELVDESALMALVREQAIKGIATDVIAHENGENRLDEWLALASHGNVIVTPHIAGATWNSMAATEEFIAEKLLNLLGK